MEWSCDGKHIWCGPGEGVLAKKVVLLPKQLTLITPHGTNDLPKVNIIQKSLPNEKTKRTTCTLDNWKLMGGGRGNWKKREGISTERGQPGL